MTTSELVRELESLTHDARMQLSVELGRAAAGPGTRREAIAGAQHLADVEAEGILAELERGGFYERRLALQSCYGSRDGARAVRFLRDPSRALRGLAIRLVAFIGDDEQLSAALRESTTKSRRALIKFAIKGKRRALVDEFLRSLAAQGDPDFDQLFPFGTEPLVREFLGRASERGGSLEWGRLARYHPQAAGERLLEEARAAKGLDNRLVWRARVALSTLPETHPDLALELAIALSRYVPLSQLPLQRLAERRPEAVADLLLAGDGGMDVLFTRMLARLDERRLLAVVERYGSHASVLAKTSVWVSKLSPARRRAVYQLAGRSWRNTDGLIARALLELLPRAEREEEARRHLELPVLQTRPTQRLPYAGLLGWEEAQAFLMRWIRDPDPELRAVAVESLAHSVRYDRGHLSDLLTVIRQRKNEQDPIRGAMLRGLSALPHVVWKAEHLDELGQIVREALNAADLSQTTASFAERLIFSLLPDFPDWAAGWMATLVRERGRISFFNLQDRLTDADVRALAPRLMPVLREWDNRERERYILGLAGSLGRRLKVWDDLVFLLERLAIERTAATASSALALIARHRPDRLPILIPYLIGRDPSWITQITVSAYLHRHRQDLLSDFLGRQAYAGRFSTGRTRFVLGFTRGFYRWIPFQQEVFADTLREIIEDEARDTPTLLRVIEQVAALPDVPPRLLIPLAAVGNPKPVTRDATLRALGKRDNGDGVPTLLDAMGDDRARIAIYALRRALLEMLPERALSTLRTVPLERVTVAKEVVRLIGDLHSEAAYATLLDFERQDLHRDVRVALLRAFWEFLEREPTWPILELAAASDDAAIATVVGRIPTERLTPASARRLTGLIASLLRHPDPKVRLDALARCAQMPLSDAEGVLWNPLLEALGSPLTDEGRAAAEAVFATFVGRQSALVGEAVRRILPNRRALQTMVAALRTSLYYGRTHFQPIAAAMLVALQDDPLTSGLRAELAIGALSGDAVAALFTRMAANDELHAGTLARLVDALSSGMKVRRPQPDDLEQLESALSAASDARLRYIAFAALRALGGTARGWSTERVAQLDQFRADPAPLVAEEAQFTVVYVGEDEQRAAMALARERRFLHRGQR